MKAMLLAAGIGRRLRPLTVCWPKPALPILGRPLITYTLALLERAGIRDFVVNLHHRPEDIKRVLSGAAGDLRLFYSEEGEILGTAGGLKNVEPLLNEETFVLANADTLVDVDVAEMVRWHRTRGGEATLLLRPLPTGGVYTPVGIDEDAHIVTMGAESSHPLMFAGVWVLEPSTLERIPARRSCGLEVALLPALIKERKAFGFVKDTPWFDIGTPRRYLGACLGTMRKRLFQELWQAIEIAPCRGDSSDRRVVAGPGTLIDSNAVFLGDSVLGSNCHIDPHAKVQRSVLWDGVRVGEHAVVRNSIITTGVHLEAGSHTENKVVLSAERACPGIRAREMLEDLVVAEIKH